MNILAVSCLLIGWASAMMMDEAPSDPITTGCVGLAGGIYAWGDGSKAESTAAWRCAQPPFLQTVVSCIDRVAKRVSSEHPKQDANATLTMAYQMLGMQCMNLTVDDIKMYSMNSTDLPAYQGSRDVKPGKRPASSAFHLADEEIWHAYKSAYYYDKAEPRNTRCGAAVLIFWAGVLVLRGVAHWGSRLFPMAVHKVDRSRTGTYVRRELVFRSVPGHGPTWLNSLVVCAFIILTLVLTFAYVPYYSPNYIWKYSSPTTGGYLYGQRSGVIPLYLMPLMILFAGRNNFLQALTGWDQEAFLVFHRWIGRMVVFEVFVHTLQMTVSRAEAGRYRSMWHEGYWKWGIVGTAFAMLIAVQGLRFLRRRSYEVFLVVHIISVIFFIVGGYYHLKLLEENLAYPFFWASIAVWAFDRALRLVRVAAANPGAVAKIKLYNNDSILAISVDRPKWWKVQQNPGSYVFVHFLHPSLFWQSHPFTLVPSTEEPNKLMMYCRVHKGATRRVAKLAAKAAAEDKDEFEVRVLLDGMYGRSHDLSEFDELVFIAGGTGIAGPFAYIQHILYKYPRGFQKMTLHWAVRDVGAAKQWFQNELAFLKDFHRVKVHLYGSNHDEEKYARLDINQVVQESLTDSRGPIAVMSCGGDNLTLAVSDAVGLNLNATHNFVQYYEESFSW